MRVSIDAPTPESKLVLFVESLLTNRTPYSTTPSAGRFLAGARAETEMPAIASFLAAFSRAARMGNQRRPGFVSLNKRLHRIQGHGYRCSSTAIAGRRGAYDDRSRCARGSAKRQRNLQLRQGQRRLLSRRTATRWPL